MQEFDLPRKIVRVDEIKHANAFAVGEKSGDEMPTDETAAPRHQCSAHLCLRYEPNGFRKDSTERMGEIKERSDISLPVNKS